METTEVAVNAKPVRLESTRDTRATIEQRLQKPCPQLSSEAREPDLPPNKAIGKKPANSQKIAEILRLQQQHPAAQNEYAFAETTGYFKCTKCQGSVHKRANEETFNRHNSNSIYNNNNSIPGTRSRDPWQQ